jgi:hypothetical protein
MRNDWVPLSASALVIGAMALVFGALLNPTQAGDSAAATLEVVKHAGGQWLGMAVMYFLGSLALTLGIPSVLSLLSRRGHRLGLTGACVFLVGTIGLSGYAMLMVFFRAIVRYQAVQSVNLENSVHDLGLSVFLYTWIGCFYGGVLILAIALFVAKSTPRWVPAVLVLFVAMLPVSGHLGRVGMAVQVMGLAVAFTGVAMAAVTDDDQQRALARASLA